MTNLGEALDRGLAFFWVGASSQREHQHLPPLIYRPEKVSCPDRRMGFYRHVRGRVDWHVWPLAGVGFESLGAVRNLNGR